MPQTSTYRGLFKAFLPPEEGGPDPDEMSRALCALLESQPRMLSSALRAGALGIDVLSVVSSGRRLANLGPARRVALMRHIASTKTLTAGVDGLKALTLLVASAQSLADDRKHAQVEPIPGRSGAS